MDYSKLSDLEINLRVAEIIYPGKKFTEAYSFGEPDGPMVQWIRGCAEFLKLDYCNKPADAWSIIVGKGISMIIHWDEDGESIDDSTWTATTNINKSWCDEREYGFESTDKNPLRAAMIVFLMIQEND